MGVMQFSIRRIRKSAGLKMKYVQINSACKPEQSQNINSVRRKLAPLLSINTLII